VKVEENCWRGLVEIKTRLNRHSEWAGGSAYPTIADVPGRLFSFVLILVDSFGFEPVGLFARDLGFGGARAVIDFYVGGDGTE